MNKELCYAKAFDGEKCIAYVWDAECDERLIGLAETTIYGGAVYCLADDYDNKEFADKIYSDVSKGRDSEAIEATKLSFENSSNIIDKNDLSFAKSDEGIFVVYNKNAIVDKAYVLIADGDSSKKSLKFFKNVSDDVKDYIAAMYKELIK